MKNPAINAHTDLSIRFNFPGFYKFRIFAANAFAF